MNPVGRTPIDVSPIELAAFCRRWLDGAIVGFDVDGVLAPLVDHADDAVLTPGVGAALEQLATKTTVAIVSGRSLESLERLFGFGSDLLVIGSHGAERRGAPPPKLDEREAARLDALRQLASETVVAVGDGAWVEEKPTSVVVQTRMADPASVDGPIAELHRRASEVEGAVIKPGSNVVELLARSVDKGRALRHLADELNQPVHIFVGDDVTDEDAFGALDDPGLSVRVGPGETSAAYRLADPDEVAVLIGELAA